MDGLIFGLTGSKISAYYVYQQLYRTQYKAMTPSTLSQHRKKIQECFTRILEMKDGFLEVREPMVRGWVRINRRKCGQPRCRCVLGELHETLAFGTREGGVAIHRGIPVEKREGLQVRTERWEAYRGRRVKLGKEFRRLLRDIDALGEALCEPWESWLESTSSEREEA